MAKPEYFAGNLKSFREAAGLTQQQLADKADMKLGGVRDLEQGRVNPTWGSVLALAQALGVDCTAFTQEPQPTEKAGPGRPKKEAEPEPEKPKRPRGRPKKGEG